MKTNCSLIVGALALLLASAGCATHCSTPTAAGLDYNPGIPIVGVPQQGALPARFGTITCVLEAHSPDPGTTWTVAGQTFPHLNMTTAEILPGHLTVSFHPANGRAFTAPGVPVEGSKNTVVMVYYTN